MNLNNLSPQQLGKLFPIIISEHKPKWKVLFCKEKELICNAVRKGSILDFEHIGSTAVPGIKAKPTIDVLMVISCNADLGELKSVFASFGYHCVSQPKNTAPHLMFAKGYTPQGFKGQVFHVHVRYPGNWDEICFRDYLIKHPEKAKQYEELKLGLAQKYKYDRDAYTDAKSEFIKNVMDLV
jgi:GrpB-like predicted nucleotidyltransferase (UPF0157 family)